MRQNRLNIIIAIITFVISAAMLLISQLIYDAAGIESWLVRALFAGAVLALTAFGCFGAVAVYSRIRKNVKMDMPKLFSGVTALLLALVFILGALGQTAYSAEFSEEVAADADKEIVLLVDASHSMSVYSDLSVSVVNAVIDSVNSDTALAIGTFTTEVTEVQKLKTMSRSDKKDAKSDFSLNIEKKGTSLTKALRWAYSVFEPGISKQKERFVIIVSDCDSAAYPEVENKLKTAGVKVYSVRHKEDSGTFRDQFLDYVISTGGFDTVVKNADDAKSDLYLLISDFGGVTNPDEIIGIGDLKFTEHYIMYDNDKEFGLNVWRIIIRVLFYFLLSVLFQLICFRSITGRTVLIIAGTSLVTGLAVTFSGVFSFMPAAIVITALLVFTVFAGVSEEDSYYV